MGFEMKFTDAPRTKRLMHTVLEALGLARLEVVHAEVDERGDLDHFRSIRGGTSRKPGCGRGMLVASDAVEHQDVEADLEVERAAEASGHEGRARTDQRSGSALLTG